MAWSYSGDPTSSPADEVRFLVGDTIPTDQQLQDGEINYALTLVYGPGNPIPPLGNYLPAAYCCDAIMARYARMVDKSVGDLKLSYTSRLKQYQAMATQLRMRAALANVPFSVGGESVGEKIGAYSNPDLIEPAVQVDGMDYSGTQPGGSQFGGGSSQTTLPE